MTTEFSLRALKLASGGPMEQTRVQGWTWTSGAAACSLCIGIISPFLGSILTAISWFTGPEWHGFFIQRFGTALLFLTIPFLIFGGICLDWAEKQNEEPLKHRSN